MAGGLAGCSGQRSLVRSLWWPEEVSGAEVGHQMGGIGLLWWRMGSYRVLPNAAVT